MSDVFSGIKRFLIKTESTTIDNSIFRLHYKVTMFLLVACSLLLTQKQYFSDPIDCLNDKIKEDILDPYCWIHDTHTVPELLDKEVGKEVAHPGIGHNPDGDNKEKYHSYYQWVTLFVYFQALLFYIPRYLWKMWEGGKIKMLATDLNSPIVDDDIRTSRQNLLVDYFKINLNGHKKYAFQYILCEVLNFANVIGQIYFTDRFLGFEFLTYGTDVLEFTNQELGTRHDPMDRVFPKVTSCTFVHYGSSGDVSPRVALCVMPLNVLNEKIFIFLWFWYIIVATLTGMGLLYRAATFSPVVRKMMLRVRARLTPAVAVEQVASHCEYGDWLILNHLAKNMDPLIFKDFILDLGRKFKGVDD